MSVSLVFLNQLLLTMTVGTVLTTLGVLPRCVRESRLQSIILLLILLSTGEISVWLFHNLWLILAVLLLPPACHFANPEVAFVQTPQHSVVCALAAEGIWLLPRSFFGTNQSGEKEDRHVEAQLHLLGNACHAVQQRVGSAEPFSSWK
jgi:hypothetical protein